MSNQANEEFISKLRKLQGLAADEAYEKSGLKNKLPEEILNFVNDKTRVLSQEQMLGTPKKRLPLWAGSVAALALLSLTCFNYFHTSLLNQESIVIKEAVKIERNGFFWGSWSLTAQTLLVKHDTALLSKKQGLELPGLGLTVHGEASFGMRSKTSLMLRGGMFDLNFESKPQINSIVLPGGGSIAITGTRLLIQAGEAGNDILLLEGNARLADRVLKPNKLVRVTSGQVVPDVDSTKVKNKLMKAFGLVENKKPAAMTLSQLKQKYGSLLKIKLKNGKTYVGAFKDRGTSTDIFTVNGKITVKTDQIDKIAPF